jgi:hypothetical protein
VHLYICKQVSKDIFCTERRLLLRRIKAPTVEIIIPPSIPRNEFIFGGPVENRPSQNRASDPPAFVTSKNTDQNRPWIVGRAYVHAL